MLEVIENRLMQVSGWLKAGPAGHFFRWWMGELRQAMPASWQQKLEHALRRVTLALDDQSLRLGVDESRTQKSLEAYSLSQDAALQAQQIEDALIENDLEDAPRFLLLDINAVLWRRMTLPQAAESNLAQVLTFEMDRQTPFRASDVYFDWKIVDRGGESGQIKLDLYVAPRSEVDQQLKTLTDRGFRLAGVDIADSGITLGLNLLPHDQRARSSNPKGRINLVMIAACVILLALVMAQSLALRTHQITELEEAIANVQGEARKVMNIKKRIEDTSEAAGFLATRRAESPLAIEILADVTRILPDDTYLDRLVISKSSVQMQGKSQNAQQLIELVNESSLLEDASFRGSTRLDARSGLEIFEVNASVLGAGEE